MDCFYKQFLGKVHSPYYALILFCIFKQAMLSKLIKFIFFGNYFIGIIALALTLETACQLRIPFCSWPFYSLLFCGTIMYYTYAYIGWGKPGKPTNPRTKWYIEHGSFVLYSQWTLLIACISLGCLLLIKNYQGLLHRPWQFWLVPIITVFAAIAYYGLLPKSFIHFNLRNTGWLKAFVIGFVWACTVSLLPIAMLQLERSEFSINPVLVIWFFVKNWMFCTVNAIMFDLKDYADDSNRQLKTFVVRFGLRKTIFYILVPLLMIGMFSVLLFTHFRNFTIVPVLINLVPFVLLLLVAYALQKRKAILYYLIVIDGLLLIKAFCGIVAMHFVPSQ